MMPHPRNAVQRPACDGGIHAYGINSSYGVDSLWYLEGNISAEECEVALGSGSTSSLSPAPPQSQFLHFGVNCNPP